MVDSHISWFFITLAVVFEGIKAQYNKKIHLRTGKINSWTWEEMRILSTAHLPSQIIFCCAAKDAKRYKKYDYQFTYIFQQLINPIQSSKSHKSGKITVGSDFKETKLAAEMKIWHKKNVKYFICLFYKSNIPEKEDIDS